MRWTQEAEEAISKVPFFVRKRVRRKVEEEAARLDQSTVTTQHVLSARRRFLERMEDELKGYRVETCFGPDGCPNRAVRGDALPGTLESILEARKLKTFLKDRVKGPLKLHHEFRVSVSDCPNACSRPQIVDFGLIGARRPRVAAPDSCTRCEACVETCREEAVELLKEGPVILEARCLACGQCIEACPTRTIVEAECGYRLLVGGKLGRHPQLGRELPGIHRPEEVARLLERSLQWYQRHCLEGERFGEILNRIGWPEPEQWGSHDEKNADP